MPRASYQLINVQKLMLKFELRSIMIRPAKREKMKGDAALAGRPPVGQLQAEVEGPGRC
jgi:hypothetical protein